VFGGNSATRHDRLAPTSDLRSLALATNVWTKLTPSTAAAPDARMYAAMALDSKRSRLLTYGGAGADAFSGSFFNDTWAFDLATSTWTQLPATGDAPKGRIRASIALDAERDRLLLFGGHDDGAEGERNDLMALDLATNVWSTLRAGDTLNGGGGGFCSFP